LQAPCYGERKDDEGVCQEDSLMIDICEGNSER
jgi:hypothetical protein